MIDRPSTRALRHTCMLATAVTLAACGGSSSLSTGFGNLNVSITDAPVDDADAVVITFTGIAVKPAAGSEVEITFATPKSIDLMALQGDVSEAILADYQLNAGNYNWIRLMVDAAASYIEISDTQYPLTIPSAAQSGLKLNRPFTIDVQDDRGFTIDFDLRSSIHEAGAGSYKLRPTLRIVDDTDRGHVSGTIDATLLDGNTDCQNGVGDVDAAIYVYDGAGVTPTDVNIDGSGGPLTTANVTFADDTYSYTVGFLEPGDYTLALTCQADEDDGEQTDALTFLQTQDATATADVTVVSNFAP